MSVTDILNEIIPLPDDLCCEKKRKLVEKRSALLWELTRTDNGKRGPINYSKIPFVDKKKLLQLFQYSKPKNKSNNMANYKAKDNFKSYHGRVFKAGEILGSKYYDVMPEQDRAHFEFYNDAPSKVLKTDELFMAKPASTQPSSFLEQVEAQKEKMRKLKEAALEQKPVEDEYFGDDDTALADEDSNDPD